MKLEAVMPTRTISFSRDRFVRTKTYLINMDAVSIVILDYQKHAAEYGVDKWDGAEMAVLFRDGGMPVLYLKGEDAALMREVMVTPVQMVAEPDDTVYCTTWPGLGNAASEKP